jgi:acyl carrier protein
MALIDAGQIRDLIVAERLVTRSNLGVDEPLVSTGLLDSLNIMGLVALIEAKFGVSIPDEALRASNFETCSVLAASLQSGS